MSICMERRFGGSNGFAIRSFRSTNHKPDRDSNGIYRMDPVTHTSNDLFEWVCSEWSGNRSDFEHCELEIECRFGIQKTNSVYTSGVHESVWKSFERFLENRIFGDQSESPYIQKQYDVCIIWNDNHQYRLSLTESGEITSIIEKKKHCRLAENCHDKIRSCDRKSKQTTRLNAILKENDEHRSMCEDANNNVVFDRNICFASEKNLASSLYTLTPSQKDFVEFIVHNPPYIDEDRNIVFKCNDNLVIETIRRKQRKRFDFYKNCTTTSSNPIPFYVDMTIVQYLESESDESHHFINVAQRSRMYYECEVEIDPDVMLEYVSSVAEVAAADRNDHITKKWKGLHRDFESFTRCISRYFSKALSNPFLEIGLVYNPEMSPLDLFGRSNFYTEKHTMKSSLPATLGWENLDRLMNEPYFVAEKTDGIRYMLYIEKDGSYYFFSRSFDKLYEFTRGYQKLWKINLIPPQTLRISDYFDLEKAPYLLDGEMVRTTNYGQPLFIIFDMITMQGNQLIELPLQNRLGYLAEVFLPLSNSSNVERRENGANIPSPPLPYISYQTARRSDWLLGIKQLFFINQWSSIKEKIKDDYDNANLFLRSNHRTPSCNVTGYYYHESAMQWLSLDRLLTKIDGFIFTPNASYELGTSTDLFKWKYPEMLTVDFCAVYVPGANSNPKKYGYRSMEMDEYAYNLCVADRNGLLIESRRCILKRVDHRALTTDQEIHQRMHGDQTTRRFVGEFSFDKKDGWKYIAPRLDKVNANVIDVVLETLERMTQNIREKDLDKVFQK